ncbi:MAG: 3-deoxy-D-manno-octulosonic acid transferase [Prevotellaceae bacterium]|nr:3-deoxy-D-manno-octulosonic acid transferase [Prevotellaceae bacterium]
MLAKRCTKPVIWIHASSLGEFGVARPIVKRIKENGNYSIFLTFFSPTGVEALANRHSDVDAVEYLPIDTKQNARRFIDTVKPQKALFIISEFWPNYLDELKRQNIETYLISGLIKSQSSIMKWYGGIIRKSLSAFTRFMVLNEESKQNLATIGLNNVSVVGDPLFDNAMVVASSSYHNKIVEAFASQGDLFIAGSISDKKDLELVSRLANTHRDIRFLVVPHEISEEHLNNITYHFEGKTICYHKCDECTDFSDIQILVIDFIGALAYLYRYAKWAYVGGGFTPYLHSVIEATVYGVPVAFGPKTNRKITPQQLMKLGIGHTVKTYKDLNCWFVHLKNNQSELDAIKEKANAYIRQNVGATDEILSMIKI